MSKKIDTLEIFFEEPTREFNIREVARILKKSPTTCSTLLKKFSKEGLLYERIERMLKLYKANLESDYYRDLKTFFMIRKIKNLGLLDALNEFYLKPTMILFGSVASGLDTETSDIDLLIISEKTSVPELKKYEMSLKRKIQIFAVKDIKDITNKHLINNIINGINLQGKIKWI